MTVPNQLVRISQDGDVLYSMRLTIMAKCPMKLRNFPMDRQSCPLIFGSFAYDSKDVTYSWQNKISVDFIPGMTLSQFDLISAPYRNITLARKEGEFSILQVAFNLKRHTGFFLIQIYIPCVLIVVLSWVSFWIHREATSDRIGLGVTTVLTMSTITLDSRNDLPRVRYATALDWFLLISLIYCIATLLEFAAVHYFTKVGSGEIIIAEDEYVDDGEDSMFTTLNIAINGEGAMENIQRRSSLLGTSPALFRERRESSLKAIPQSPVPPLIAITVERMTQTENTSSLWMQIIYCLKGDQEFRKQRQREATSSDERGRRLGRGRHVNSVSRIDRTARVVFPASFAMFNFFYWWTYVTPEEDFKWEDTASIEVF